MSINLKIFLIILLLVLLTMIVKTTKRKKLTMKYASFWIFLILIMAVVVIFPELVFRFSNFVGFEKPSNMIFLLGFFFLFYVSFIITISVSIQNEKTKNIIQELSIFKESVEKNGKRK